MNPNLRVIRPAGQTAPLPPIDVAENGRISGVDGMLSQVAEALAREAGPMIARDILPVLQRDHDMQRRMAAAAGAAAANELKPWIVIGATALTVIAVVQIFKLTRKRR